MDEKDEKDEDDESFSANSFATMFGAFLSDLENVKQGNARSPGIFSGGISINHKISEVFISVSLLINWANFSLKIQIIFPRL